MRLGRARGRGARPPNAREKRLTAPDPAPARARARPPRRWLKNLQHVRFGRMTKKWEERSKLIMVEQFNKLGARMDAKDVKALLQGPTERDIVYSGLEDTMAVAVAETIATANKHGVSYRLAGFINAIQKIAVTYKDAGITMA